MTSFEAYLNNIEDSTVCNLYKNRRLVSSVDRAPVCCAGGRWFEPFTGPTLRVLKITEENVLPL